MSARIEAVKFVRSNNGLFGKGSIKLAVEAALACLKEVDMPASDVDLLINTGIYRDNNLGEPAIASLIQQGIKANPGVREDGGPGTFSFDLANGGCGLISAMQLVHSYMEAKDLDVGLVVTSDVDPAPGTSERYNFVPAGAAILLEAEDEPVGFTNFLTKTFPKYEDMFESRVVFKDHKHSKGRNVLQLTERKAYMARCVDCADKTVTEFMEQNHMDPKMLDLIIPSQSPVGFPKKFRVRMGLRRSRVIDVSEEYGALHTAGPAAALAQVVEDGRFARAENVLFVTVGAGITVSLALYCKEKEEALDKEGLPVEEGDEAELKGMLEEDEGDMDGSEG
jgi:3-oxoacyl-[acyl-carrier-protein] synthase III